MKSLLLALLAVGSLSLNAQIAGTKHDLSSTGPGGKTNTTQVCVFCHAPHNTAATPLAPLWNRNAVVQSFTMYTSGTIKGTVDASPTGASLACFTCHDGTTAVGNVANLPMDAAGTLTYTAGGLMNATGVLTGTVALGTDLSNDHPVAITYQNNLNSGLKDPTTFAANTVKLFPSNVQGAKVQCASCHDVHSAAIDPFLRVSMSGSALCTACHSK